MASDNFSRIVAAALGLLMTAAIAFWHKIMDWAGNVLFPWLERNLQNIAPLVKDAFVWFDQNVAVPVRRAIKNAWKKLREYLLKLAVQFERTSANEWVRRWTGYIIKVLENGRTAPVRFEAEEVVAWDELPPDVRQEWLKRGMPTHEIDITALRDQQMEMEMTQ